jgi:dTDP-4-dehydrorhamnose reductase
LDNPKTSILITGGSGLLALNWAVTMSERYAVTLGLNDRKIKLSNAAAIPIDLTSVEDFCMLLEELRPAVVIHTAGLTSVEACERNPALAKEINVELSVNVAKATKQLGIKLVHISTDHLFDGTKPNISEDEPIVPLNEYGKTKAEAEQRVLSVNEHALIVRTNFYGWGTSYRKSFSDLIIQSLRKHQVLYLFDDVHYTPILAKNLIQTVHDLLDKNVKGIFHVVSDDRISKYEFGVLIADEFGLDKSLIHKSTLQSQTNLVQRPVDMSLSNRKVCELLGRNLGTVKQHIALLHQKEIEVETQKIQLL